MNDLIHYQALLHRMIHQKLQWLDYYGDDPDRAAVNACRAFSALVVHIDTSVPADYLVQLHDQALYLAQESTDHAAQDTTRNILGMLFNRSRDIYIAVFESDPIRTLPTDHPRFPWEYYAEPPVDPGAIDLRALTDPLPAPVISEKPQPTLRLGRLLSMSMLIGFTVWFVFGFILL